MQSIKQEAVGQETADEDVGWFRGFLSSLFDPSSEDQKAILADLLAADSQCAGHQPSPLLHDYSPADTPRQHELKLKALQHHMRRLLRHLGLGWQRKFYIALCDPATKDVKTLSGKDITAAVEDRFLKDNMCINPAAFAKTSSSPALPDDSDGPPCKRMRAATGDMVLVLPQSAKWLINLCIDPMLMQLSPTQLKSLMGTCRQLRVAVHRFASILRFSAHALLAGDRDLHMLGRNQWHGLKVLELQQSVDCTLVCYLTMGQLPQLSSLKLSLPFCTRTATQLAEGNWPLLSQLNLSNSRLTTSAMAAIKRGKWPCLKGLVLQSCHLDPQDLFHVTNADWHELELIDLFGNDLGSKDFRNLSMGMWPKLKVLHAGSIVESVAMTRLLAGQWPQLKELTFAAKWPSVPATIGFPQAPVYAVGPLRGLPAVKHCCIYQPHFCQSLAACLVSSWHANLGSLDLAGCDISGAALQPFDRVRWPCLTELRLSGSNMDAEAMGYVATGKMPLLQHLVLENCKGVDAAALLQLSKSFLPQLKVLALSYSLLPNGQAVPAGVAPEMVDMESINCMKALAKARWPRLESLELAGCRVTGNALMELVKGQWPELLHLDLTCCGLLLKCPESLRDSSRQSFQLRKGLFWPNKLLEGGLWPKLNCIDVSIEQ